MNEYTHFSSRKFKTDHLRRLKILKEKLGKSQQMIVVDAVEIGLTYLENSMYAIANPASLTKGRIVPFGIEEIE